MNKELETIIERYESILQDMHQTLKAIEQGKQDSQRISDIHQFLSQFNSIDEFLAHIRNIEERLFYLKDELTTKEAAIYLGMSVSTLYKKTMNSEIPFYRPSTRHLYFKRQELAQWMLQNRHATNEELQAEATSKNGKAMTRHNFANLIERAEQLVAAIDKWRGMDAVCNRIDIIDECLLKMDARKDVLVQLEKMPDNMYLFKAILTVDEAALYLGVHRNMIHKLIRNNGLTAFSPSSTKMLILTEDLVEWCRQHPNGEPDSEAKLSDNQKRKDQRNEKMSILSAHTSH